MAEIVLGVGTSHTPQITSGAEMLRDHAKRDLDPACALLGPDGEFHTYEELLAQADPAYEAASDTAVWKARYERAQECLDELAARLDAVEADVILIVGDDQEELFHEDGTPAIGMFIGETIADRPPADEVLERLPPSLKAGLWAQHGAKTSAHVVARALSTHLATTMTGMGFDPMVMRTQREERSLGHAFTFVNYRLGAKLTTPIVPIFLNTYYPPNVPSPERCFDLGRSLRQGIETWGGAERVAVVASGGLSHFVVLEDFDRALLEGIRTHDTLSLTSTPRRFFRSGTSEALIWIAAAGVLEDAKLEVLDYIPGYRTAAGTGVGLAFAAWQP